MTLFRRFLVALGVTLIVSSVTWLVGGLVGILPTDMVEIAGHSGLRAIGSIAVAGCMLGAIGSWES
jgi:hypothetical protein